MYWSSAAASGTGVMGLARPGITPARSASVGTVAYSSSGLELRVPETVRNTVSLPLGLTSFGMNGAPIKVTLKRLVPDAGCSCGCPRRLKGWAFRAELLPVQKMEPWGWLGLKLGELGAHA